MTTHGTIYAIGIGETPYVKIGSTTQSMRERMRTLQVGVPYDLVLIASVVVGEKSLAVEKHIHATLRPYQKRGEWFEAPMDQIRLQQLVSDARAVVRTRSTPPTPTGEPRVTPPSMDGKLTLAEAAHLCGYAVQRLRRAVHCNRHSLDAQGRVTRENLMLAGYLPFPRTPQ